MWGFHAMWISPDLPLLHAEDYLQFTISLLFTDGVNVVRFVDCLQETGRRFQKPAPHSQPPDTTRNNELRTKDELLRTGSFGSVLRFNLITPGPLPSLKTQRIVRRLCFKKIYQVQILTRHVCCRLLFVRCMGQWKHRAGQEPDS